MRLIIGTGGCGFQRINQIMNRLGHPTSFKVNPVKMQNSSQVNFETFIKSKLNNTNEILIGHFYIDYIKGIILNNPSSKIICLKGNRERTINSLFLHFGFRNPLISNRGNYSRYNLNFFKDYSTYESKQSLESYYDDYYNEIETLKKEFENNIIIVDSEKYFHEFDYQENVNSFLNVHGAITEEKYQIKDNYDITCSLHGGLGNNLFQMIEPLIFCHINGLPSPTFNSWDCVDLPKCNNSDIILGGHGGTWKDFSNSFKNLTFTDTKIASFDTKFMINDMFDFGVLNKYRDIILNKFEPSDEILKYIFEKYENIFIDSCSLHIRTWTSLGDVHSMPLDNSYYEKSLSIINSKNVLVFTDNIINCQPILNYLSNKFTDKNFKIIDENQFISLFMISMCEKNIVNISTFSFWGAFLNKNQNNNIIIPNNFGHGPNMVGELNWIKI
jgi:hypothetical protein